MATTQVNGKGQNLDNRNSKKSLTDLYQN